MALPQPLGAKCSMVAVQEFNLADTPAASGPVQFQHEMEKLFSVGLTVRAPDARPFRTQMTAYCGAKLRFAALHFSPHTTSSMQVGQRPSRLLVTLQKRGVARVAQDGRESRVEPGDMFMIDPSRPFSIETGEIVTHSVYLEPDAVRSVVPDIEALTARVIKGSNGAGALFRALMDEMFTLAPSLQEPTADRIAVALPFVLGAALTSLERTDEAVASRVKLMHRHRIERVVHDNLRNHDLDAALVARAVNLSTRHVYELFTSNGEPLMKWVWGLRLARCHADLGTPALRSRPIGEIAYYWGFNDVAHFSRAFRARYGQSPREYRSACESARLSAH